MLDTGRSTETVAQYKARILSYQAGADPLALLAAAPDKLASLVQDVSSEDLSHHLAPGKWSIKEIVAHLADAELVGAYRIRMILSMPGTPIQAFDQDLWARSGRYDSGDFARSLRLFKALREANLTLLRSLSAEEWNFHGIHSERGVESVRDIATLYAGHDINHLTQIEAILQTRPKPTVMTPVGLTSRWVAANRALETESEAPLYRDPYARALAGEPGFAMMSASRAAMGLADSASPDAYLTIRTKFFDEMLLRAVRESSIDQVVILAAGMDARAMRLDWPRDLVLFEVDRDDVFEHKEAVLASLNARPACDRRIVRVDLAGPWTAALTEAGFASNRPAAILVEGLLMYLDDSAVAQLFTTLRALATEGSWIGADIMSADMLTSAYTTNYLKELEKRGFPWKFGVNDPEEFLAKYGWRGTAVLPGEPEANYGRWPFPVIPRTVPGLPRIYLVQATRREG